MARSTMVREDDAAEVEDVIVFDATSDPDAEDEVREDYTSLYRKYRPRKFSEVLGQHDVTDGLRRTVASGRVNHAYLLSGPRGCGKTTSARILASALNCPFLEDGEPCGKCDSCVSTMNGGYAGVVQELNAADNRGIDDMRNLLSTVDLGVSAKYKIIILDEVHQLTREASSVLLKTLEEPPTKNLVFILATTDPQKVLDTIRSRTVPLTFGLLRRDDLTELVTNIVAAEHLKISDQQIRSVVSAGRGSARDTISALERVSMGISLSDQHQYLLDITDGLLDGDLASVLVTIAEMDMKSDFNPYVLGEEVLTFWRDALLYQQNPTLVMASEDFEERIAKAAKMPQARLVRNIDAVATTLGSMRATGSNRIILEAGLAKLMVPSARGQMDAVIDALADTDRKVSVTDRKVDLAVRMIEAMLNGAVSGSVTFDIGAEPESETAEREPEEKQQVSRRGRPSRGAAAQPIREEQIDDAPADTPAATHSTGSERTDDARETWLRFVAEAGYDSGRIYSLLVDADVSASGDELVVTTQRRLAVRAAEALQAVAGGMPIVFKVDGGDSD